VGTKPADATALEIGPGEPAWEGAGGSAIHESEDLPKDKTLVAMAKLQADDDIGLELFYFKAGPVSPGLTRAHSEMVDFGSGQGRRDYETAGAAPRISKYRERRPGPKDAVYGWALEGGFNPYGPAAFNSIHPRRYSPDRYPMGGTGQSPHSPIGHADPRPGTAA
jgi:hypothetical protein